MLKTSIFFPLLTLLCNSVTLVLQFCEEMHKTRDMWAAMRAMGYKDHIKMLTRDQVRTIVKFLGEP